MTHIMPRPENKASVVFPVDSTEKEKRPEITKPTNARLTQMLLAEKKAASQKKK